MYELSSNFDYFDPTLEKCLFGVVCLTINASIEKYKYSQYGTGFDEYVTFSFPNAKYGRNAIIFGVGVRSGVHIDNSKHINCL